MPPEALNDNKYSFKSDVWALGVIFYEMLTGKTPWRAKTEKELGRQLMSIPISQLIPKNICPSSKQFLLRTLTPGISERMSIDELALFQFPHDNKYEAQSTKADLLSSNSISDPRNILLRNTSNRDLFKETSLNRNTISTPKNIKRFNFLKVSAEQETYNPFHNNSHKNNSNLMKGSNSVSMLKTEHLMSPTNQNFNPANNQTGFSNFTSTHKDIANFRSTNTLATIIDKKQLSK